MRREIGGIVGVQRTWVLFEKRRGGRAREDAVFKVGSKRSDRLAI